MYFKHQKAYEFDNCFFFFVLPKDCTLKICHFTSSSAETVVSGTAGSSQMNGADSVLKLLILSVVKLVRMNHLAVSFTSDDLIEKRFWKKRIIKSYVEKHNFVIKALMLLQFKIFYCDVAL